jgi:hypothetical protein
MRVRRTSWAVLVSSRDTATRRSSRPASRLLISYGSVDDIPATTVEILDLFDPLIALADAPSARYREEIQPVVSAIDELPFYHIMARIQMPSLLRTRDAVDAQAIRQAMARVALAAALFRRAHGTWPGAAGDLEPYFPGGVPRCPVRDEPFRFEVDNGDLLIRTRTTEPVLESLQWRLRPPPDPPGPRSREPRAVRPSTPGPTQGSSCSAPRQRRSGRHPNQPPLQARGQPATARRHGIRFATGVRGASRSAVLNKVDARFWNFSPGSVLLAVPRSSHPVLLHAELPRLREPCHDQRAGREAAASECT